MQVVCGPKLSGDGYGGCAGGGLACVGWGEAWGRVILESTVVPLTPCGWLAAWAPHMHPSTQYMVLKAQY